MSHRRFVYLGIGGVIAIVLALTFTGLNDSLTYYLYPSEAVDQRADFPDGERFRLAGIVVAGTVVEADESTSFEVTDGGADIPVVLNGPQPSLFAEEVPLLLEGAWSGDTFQADSALIRHDENYEVPEEGGALPGGLMLAFLGSAGVIAALIGSILLVVRGIRRARGGEADIRTPGKLVLAGAVISMVAMQVALLTDDFSLAYVANHHSSATPFPFDVATAWAALEGSIILWGLVLAVFTWVVVRQASDRLGSAAVAVMAGVGVFFFGLMITVANPFEVCVDALATGCAASSAWPFTAADVPANGPGPNPLLQNHFLMAVHPPVLYIGYVGLTVPFAYAIGALALGVPGPEWLRRSHRSTLVAWSFLTLGITLGGWWAYEVLSWGGYWAWDPVENASLMPWLVATAFIHSGLVQQRRGMLQAWNFVLVISAFALTILGTFLTRSGTINSVHSFTQSAIGPALLGFLVLVLVGSFTLFAMRSHLVASSPRIETFVIP